MAGMIRITAGGVQVTAGLDDSETARAISAALPLKGRVQRWGGEIYFPVPVDVTPAEDAREVLRPGELAFWPPGRAICIFFGPTPASHGDEIRAASNVNVFGRINGDLSALWDVADGQTVVVEAAEEGED